MTISISKCMFLLLMIKLSISIKIQGGFDAYETRTDIRHNLNGNQPDRVLHVGRVGRSRCTSNEK